MAIITDSIAERTAGAGVTVDGLLIKDGLLPGVSPADIGAEAAGSAATAVADHESAYDHANIPTADQSAALAAYEIALGLAEAGQVLTASGPGAASFAAPAGGGASLHCTLPVESPNWRGDNASAFVVPIDTNWHTLGFSGVNIPGLLFVRLEIYVSGATGVYSLFVRPGGLASDANGVLIGKGIRNENNPVVQFASVPSNDGTIDVKISSIPAGGSALIIFADLIAAIIP